MGTSTPGTWPPTDIAPRRGAPGRRRRIILAGGLVFLLAAVVGVGMWATSDPGGYRTSRNGCVTLTIASSTGGAMRHECGDAARAWCRAAFTDSDNLALLTRPQCRAAGLAPESK